MKRRALQIILRTTAAVLIALAIVVAAALYTPLGTRVALSMLMPSDSGLSLSFDSVSGSPFGGFTLGGVSLADRNGAVILEAGRLEGRIVSVGLFSRRVEIGGAVVENARLVFETREEGGMVGWSDMASKPEEGAAARGGQSWEIALALALRDVTVEIRNAAAGTDVVLGSVAGDARGTVSDLTASLGGSLLVELSSLAKPVTGTFRAQCEYTGTGVAVGPLEVSTDAGDATVRGALAFPGPKAEGLRVTTADLEIASSHELGALLALFGVDGAELASGILEAESTLKGPLDGPAYVSHIDGSNISMRGAAFESVSATVDGDRTRVSFKDVRAAGLGGTLDAEGTVELSGDGSAIPVVTASGRFERMDIRALAGLSPGSPDVGGTLSGHADVQWSSADLRTLAAAFNLEASGLRFEEKQLGTLSASGRVERGAASASGECCDARLELLAELSESGVREATASVESDDLAMLGTTLGSASLSGSATARLKYDARDGAPTVIATGESPDLAISGVSVAPAHMEATGFGDQYSLQFTGFGGAISGTGSYDSESGYGAMVMARDFDLAAVLPDSLRESMQLAGVLNASATVRGRPGGSYQVEGEVTGLSFAVRRQSAELAAPFLFAASPDSVRITEAALNGTFGDLTVAGAYTRASALDARASIRRLDLSQAYELLPVLPSHRPTGILAGDVSLAGTRAAPELEALVTMVEFEMSGLGVDSVELDVSADSTDVVFDLTAKSGEKGEVMASGSVPVRPDEVSVLAFDPLREFGVSVVSSGFVLDAGDELLPRVTGKKRFTMEGSAVLTGTADSFESVNGSGLFSGLSAEFDLARFSLADTSYFQVQDGIIQFNELVVDVQRRHVLGEPAGGRVTASGTIDPNGAVDLVARADELDVGHVVRALGGRTAGDLRGHLTAEVSATGSARDPQVVYQWTVRNPRISELGFDEAHGGGTLDSHVLHVDTAELVAGGRAIGLTGEIVIPSGPGGAAFDLYLTADDVRLGDLRSIPQSLTKLGGRLSADLNVRGRPDSVDIRGAASLKGGKIGGMDLKEPLRDISVELEAEGTSVTVASASAKLGGGRIEAGGGLDASGGLAAATFDVWAKLDSPEFEVEDLLTGKAKGRMRLTGSMESSTLQGRVVIEEMKITRSFGLTELVTRRPQAIVVRRVDDPRSRVNLNIGVQIEDVIEVRSKAAELDLKGGATLVGTLLEPRVSGTVYAEEGKFAYLDNEFEIESLEVGFIDPERRDPHVRLTGTAEVRSRSDELYVVTVSVNGFASEVVPELSSVPPLSSPDIVTLLTFGDTFGAFVASDGQSDSSGDRFSALAGRAFLSSAFGIAEGTLERVLNLDRVSIEGGLLDSQEIADTNITLGKEFGRRLRVNYSTAVGRFSNQRLEVSFEVLKRLWLETRTDPEGNNAVGVRLLVPFK